MFSFCRMAALRCMLQVQVEMWIVLNYCFALRQKHPFAFPRYLEITSWAHSPTLIMVQYYEAMDFSHSCICMTATEHDLLCFVSSGIELLFTLQALVGILKLWSYCCILTISMTKTRFLLVYTRFTFMCTHCYWQNGVTPLMFAAINGHFKTVVFLVNAGADPNVQNKVSCTPVLESYAWVYASMCDTL